MKMFSKLKSLFTKAPGETPLAKPTASQLLSLKETARRLQGVFAERLEPLGFRARGTAFVRERCPIAWDKISIQMLTYDKYETNAPFFRADIHVGIRSDPVERLYVQISGRPGRKDQQTFNRLIGYLMPQERPITWHFARDHFPEKAAHDMIDSTIRYGLPYTEQFKTWEAIYAEMTQRESHPFIRRPIIQYLMGRPEEAVALLNAELAGIEDQHNSGAEYYRGLANKLIVLCKSP